LILGDEKWKKKTKDVIYNKKINLAFKGLALRGNI